MASNFASTKYASAFHDLPVPDTDAFRRGTLEYLSQFDPRSWYNEPIRSLLRGKKLEGRSSAVSVTKDAFGTENGHQYFATPSQVEELKEHIKSYNSPYTDVRTQMRRIEQQFLSKYAGFLIGNQALDFGKQDGITEMEEAVMANAVERRLNDMLIEEEASGKVSISRKPIYVSCVSNFTNFLDLFRKTIRCLELGIPCIVLGRSNTVQHSFRWSELLSQLLEEEGVDSGMLTYLSCTLDDIKDITQTCKDHTGNLYATCSRSLAASIKSSYPNTVASTGGPNTLVTTEWTATVRDAIRMSASIECAGQCTALRHCVVPETVTNSQIAEIFDAVTAIPSATKALEEKMFDGVFEKHKGSTVPSETDYTRHRNVDAYYRIGHELPDEHVEEYWRKVVVDVTRSKPEDENSILALASWLNTSQPISLAVNGPREQAFDLGMSLFEKTGMVVFTVGSTDTESTPPALTCQARPQEAEVFGEFPPRKSLGDYTRFPVVVPSSTPSYDSVYTTEYLESQSLKVSESSGAVQAMIGDISSSAVQGYCVELLEYLSDATSTNPKRGFGTSRTALWGLQRPPLLHNLKTCIRCTATTQFDDVAPVYILFFATNARSQVELSIEPSNSDLISICKKHGLPATMETEDKFCQAGVDSSKTYYNIINGGCPTHAFPMASQFVSLYFPLGHVKSTMGGDEGFVATFAESRKWLKMLG